MHNIQKEKGEDREADNVSGETHIGQDINLLVEKRERPFPRASSVIMFLGNNSETHFNLKEAFGKRGPHLSEAL